MLHPPTPPTPPSRPPTLPPVSSIRLSCFLLSLTWGVSVWLAKMVLATETLATFNFYPPPHPAPPFSSDCHSFPFLAFDLGSSVWLVQVVFATETLAAGINMPARTTVISTLSRRRDSSHSALLHNELLQMAGRAGRRGFDTAGQPQPPSHMYVLNQCLVGVHDAVLHQ